MQRLFVPKQAAGANLVYFDLFNATSSGCRLQLVSVIPVVSGEVAVTGTVGLDLFLTRTTAVGTGGTAATVNGTSLTAMTITGMDSQDSLPAGITARLTPTGGATAGAVISSRGLFTEETNSAAYNQIWDMVRCNYIDIPNIVIPQGTGIRVVQGSVASVGNIGFDVAFHIVRL